MVHAVSVTLSVVEGSISQSIIKCFACRSFDFAQDDRDRQFCIKEGLPTSEIFKDRVLLVFSGH